MNRTEDYSADWALDPGVMFLNHGSFGARTKAVIARQRELREEMDRQPMTFLARTYQDRLDATRDVLARFVGAASRDLVFVRNATTAVNGVLRSLPFKPGDEVIITTHGYRACNKAVEYALDQAGGKVVTADVPFPIDRPEQAVEAILARVTARTRLALVDHITSPTALILPVERIVAELDARGVDTLIDGAHAPGMVPLDIDRIGAAYYTGNLHKWPSLPVGAAFLWVRPDRQEWIHPAVVSHGYRNARAGRSALQEEFDWQGTDDPTSWLCLETSLAYFDDVIGGIDAAAKRNHELAVKARLLVREVLETAPPCPDEMLGSMATVPLRGGRNWAAPEAVSSAVAVHPLQRRLNDEFRIEIPVVPWPSPSSLNIRLSVHLYNAVEQYEILADALRQILLS